MVGGEILTSNVKEHIGMYEWSERPMFVRTNKKTWRDVRPASLTKPPRSSLGALGLALGNSLFGLQIQVSFIRSNVKAQNEEDTHH